MAEVFTLKARDTLPVLTVTLRNPDGAVTDLTGATSVSLHVRTNQGAFTRTMTVDGSPTLGTVKYAWVAGDWAAGQLPVLTFPDTKFYPIEYEVLGGTSPMTFPNTGHDWLCIVGDLA